MNPNKEKGIEQDTPINIQKTAKKAAIGWLVPFVLGIICYGFLALARAQGDKLYEKKEDAAQVQQITVTRLNHDEEEIDVLKNTLASMDKKMDRLQYTVEYQQQQDHRNLSPKAKDQQP